jgi:hypothetical protein
MPARAWVLRRPPGGTGVDGDRGTTPASGENFRFRFGLPVRESRCAQEPKVNPNASNEPVQRVLRRHPQVHAATPQNGIAGTRFGGSDFFGCQHLTAEALCLFRAMPARLLLH